jgi:hypothetical protein
MNDSQQPETLLQDLVTRLDFQPGDAERVFGEVHGSPVTMILIDTEPLSLFLGFKIVSTHPEEIRLPEEIESLVDNGRADVSLEDGTAWLSLDDLRGQSSSSIQSLIESFGEALYAAKVTFAPGCVSCGGHDDVNLLFAEGSCSRLCPECARDLFQKREDAEQQLNSPSVMHAFGLPLAFLYVSGGWLILWFLIDVLLTWWNTDTIVIPGGEGFVVLAAVLGAVGFGLGYPIGAFLRRSGVAHVSPLAVSLSTVIAACVVGEMLLICAIVFRQTGVLDVAMATQQFIPFVKSYQPSWITGKVVAAAAIALGCYVATIAKKTVPLQL